jgi:hypothetical protein
VHQKWPVSHARTYTTAGGIESMMKATAAELNHEPQA